MRQMILRAAALCALAAATTAAASAQTPDASASPEPAARASAPRGGGMTGGLFALDEVERQLREQREEIEQLRAAVREQSRLIGELRSRVEGAERLAGAAAATGAARDGAVLRDASYAEPAVGDAKPTATANSQGPSADAALEARVARAEEQSKKASEAVAKQIGSMTFSGDLRFRYESFYG